MLSFSHQLHPVAKSSLESAEIKSTYTYSCLIRVYDYFLLLRVCNHNLTWLLGFRLDWVGLVMGRMDGSCTGIRREIRGRKPGKERADIKLPLCPKWHRDPKPKGWTHHFLLCLSSSSLSHITCQRSNADLQPFPWCFQTWDSMIISGRNAAINIIVLPNCQLVPSSQLWSTMTIDLTTYLA